MTDKKTTATAKPTRWVRILLILSLGLNLLILGSVVGLVARGGPDGRMPPPARDITAPYTRSFSPEDRKSLRKFLRDEYRGKTTRRSDIFQEYRQAIDLLRADPLDGERLEALLGEQVKRATSRLDAGQRALAQHLKAMSFEDRISYASRLEEEVNKLTKREGRKGQPPKRP